MTRDVWTENGSVVRAIEMGVIKILLASIPVMSDNRESVSTGHLHLCVLVMLVVVVMLLLLLVQMHLLLLLMGYLGPIIVSRHGWLIHAQIMGHGLFVWDVMFIEFLEERTARGIKRSCVDTGPIRDRFDGVSFRNDGFVNGMVCK